MRVNTASTKDRARMPFGRAIPMLAVCALLSSSCSAANAHSWQCSAPLGRYEVHDIEVPRAATQFTGEMVIRKAEGLSRWHPTAQLGFNDISINDFGCHCNGIVATWYPDNPKLFLVSLVADGKETPLGYVPYDKPVTFKLDFTWDGKLRLEVGTGVVTATSQTPMRNNLHMSCSSADADFKVIVTPPPAPSAERCAVAAREQWDQADLERYCKIGGQAK